jgi:hypothetical protein
LDGEQSVIFYYIDPGYAMERHAGKAKFKNKFYYQYEREESWTRPGVRAFGRANGGLAFQGFQKVAGNAVPLCSVFYADKAGSTKNCTHHPIYRKWNCEFRSSLILLILLIGLCSFVTLLMLLILLTEHVYPRYSTKYS